MSKKFSLKNTAIFAIPLAVLIGMASYIGYSVHKQNKILEDVAFMVQNTRPIITDREQLHAAFNDYITISGLNVTRSATGVNSVADSSNKNAKNYVPSSSDERIYGNPDAQFYLIEYSDFECPYCKEHFPQLLDLVDSSSGNIALVFKHVPVHGQASQVESLAAECAAEQNGNPGFYKLARAIFENTQSDGRGLTTPLDVLAERNGFDGKRLIECINSARPAKKIGADVREAAGLNIQQTPSTIVVHGERSAIVQGMVNGTGIMQMMAQLVDREH
ncbi:thioredoxin domain-containing protein [Xenorhabdus sp. KJ12.1]|uniref:DsbA family protein n=1 Tax=Xenorhabdus sp. KJ12.1 TaxID=1851571 RepID=UPI000C051670|nr:thioredoxin domain-containing protein [Xenorhabdus sp. KJ12.1]PHM72184.1 lipoprotein [Xenorhabdus sp. KJ12.1]